MILPTLWGTPLGAIVTLALGACVILLGAKSLAKAPPQLTAVGVVSVLLAFYVNSLGGWNPVVAGTCAVAILGLLLVPTFEIEITDHISESAALLLLGAGGVIALGTAQDLLWAIVGLETLALSAVTLVAMSRGSLALEAAFKYFVLGGISLASMLYGLGLIYLATGSFAYPTVELVAANPLILAGTLLIALGFAFEMAVFPFHSGGLDAYSASSPGIAGYVMSASKLAAAFALARLVMSAGAPIATVMVWIGVLTIIWGTVGAMAQSELRRMLAYSAITHAGFIALAVGSGPQGPTTAVVYAVSYGAMALLTFASLSGRGTQGLPYASIGAEHMSRPRAAALSLGLLALSGIPPTPGFWIKLAVLVIAWQNAGPLPTIIAVAGGVLSVLYYLRPIPDLFAALRTAPARDMQQPALPAIGLAAVAVLAISLAPGLVWALLGA